MGKICESCGYETDTRKINHKDVCSVCEESKLYEVALSFDPDRSSRLAKSIGYIANLIIDKFDNFDNTNLPIG